MEQQRQSVFLVMLVNDTGKKIEAYSTLEYAQGVCDSANRHAKGAVSFCVVEFRRVNTEPSTTKETLTLTAPEGTIGAIGTTVEELDSESTP